jgi:hypothetical protein
MTTRGNSASCEFFSMIDAAKILAVCLSKGLKHTRIDKDTIAVPIACCCGISVMAKQAKSDRFEANNCGRECPVLLFLTANVDFNIDIRGQRRWHRRFDGIAQAARLKYIEVFEKVQANTRFLVIVDFYLTFD